MPTAAPPSRDDARWQFLREWWEELRSPAPPMVEGTPSMTGQRCGYGRMRVFPPVQDARAEERWAAQRDALELVTLLSRVDAPAFLRMMREFCVPSHGTDSDWRDFPDDEDFEAPLAVDIRIEDDMLGDGDTTEWAEHVLATLLAPVPLSMRTRRFRNARKEVLSHVASHQERQVLEAAFVVPVQVGMWVGPPAPAITIVEKLAGLQQQMQHAHDESKERMEEARRAALRAFPFRLMSVDVIADDETLSPAFMKSVHGHVMDDTIKLGDAIFRTSDLESATPIDRRGFAHFVTAVCAPSGQSVIYDIPDRTGAKVVRVEASLGLFPFVQLCSALTFSKGVQELVVDDMLELPDDMSRRQRWAMILYAVFSAEAKNDIYRLNLGDFELTDGDLMWMRALFEAHDPIERLLLYHLAENPSPTDVTTRSERILVKANAKLNVCRGFQRLFDVETHEPLTFYEFRGWGTGVEVIAPAFGNVVVPREHISCVKPVDRETHTWWNLESHSIKSLEIRSFGEQDDPDHVNRMRNLGGLLGIIGRPLEELSLLCDLPQPEELLDMVWPACVNLKKLEMYYPNFQSLQYLVDAYESGKCNIQSLYLEELRLVDTSSMEVFIATLADPTSRMARTLLELRLMLKDDNEAFAAGQHSIALAQALSTNETLKYLSVNGEEEYYANVKPLYDQLHNSWIPGFVSRDLFPLSCKCAFLSVVEKMNGRDQTQGRCAGASSIAQLDSRVLSIIFEMSGTPKRRTVILRRSE